MHIPFSAGRSPSGTMADFWTPRRLDGTYGITGEFDFVNFGGSAMIGLRRTDIEGSFVNPDSITTVRNFGQVWYSNVISDNSNSNVLRYKIGVGFHQIGHDAIFKNGAGSPVSVETTEPPTSYLSPYIKLEYMNQQSAERFGASLQYYSEWMLGGAWLEIIPNRVRLEVRAGAPIFRKRYYYESTHFLTLNVPITFSL